MCGLFYLLRIKKSTIKPYADNNKISCDCQINGENSAVFLCLRYGFFHLKQNFLSDRLIFNTLIRTKSEAIFQG